ncbi:universal stress protein [Oceanidesulfovibrio indonesiensis]|nr:universal stress protein [Oceanidesulfovibrio indonesiensis]
MERHLLITISEDQTALFGVRFAASFFSAKDHVRITLLYIAPGEDDPDVSATSALSAAHEKCLSFGFSESMVDSKSLTRRTSLIKDILAEAQRGMYDAVVLGRRGVSRLEEVLGESTSRRILEESAVTPVWICRIPDPTRKNVLLCMDGSEQAYRMADHVGFILGSEQDHDVTILCVLEPGSDPESMNPVVQRATALLTENGMDAKRITSRVENNDNPAQTIATLARDEGFAVVAAGRAASVGSVLGQLFTDSVSASLFRDSGGSTLWVAK